MSVGKMKYLIMIKRLISDKNQYGEQKNNYYPKYQLKCDIIHKSASTKISDDMIIDPYSLIIRIWKRKIDKTDIITYEGDDYQIISINDYFGLQQEIILSKIVQ